MRAKVILSVIGALLLVGAGYFVFLKKDQVAPFPSDYFSSPPSVAKVPSPSVPGSSDGFGKLLKPVLSDLDRGCISPETKEVRGVVTQLELKSGKLVVTTDERDFLFLFDAEPPEWVTVGAEIVVCYKEKGGELELVYVMI